MVWCLNLISSLSCTVLFIVLFNCCSIDEVGNSNHHGSGKIINKENSISEINNQCFFNAKEKEATPDHTLSQSLDREEVVETVAEEARADDDDSDIKDSSDIIKQSEQQLSSL